MIHTTQRSAQRACIVAFAAGTLATLATLVAMQMHYVAFDDSALVFVHERIPEAARYGNVCTAALALMCGAVFALAILMRERRLTRQFVARCAALQAIVLVAFAALPIAIDSDQYAYAGYAYQGLHGDPYRPHALDAAAPLAERSVGAHWGNPIVADRYGPFWTAIQTAVLAPVMSAPLWMQVFATRLLACVASVIATLLLGYALRGRPYSSAALVAFAFNPLVLVEFGNGAHNEAVMIAFGFAALASLRGERPIAAAIALGAAAATKFAYAAAIVPLAASVLSLRKRWSDAALAVCAFAASLALAASPYGLAASLLDPARSVVGRSGGLTGLVGEILRHVPGVGTHGSALVAAAFLVLFVAALALFSFDVLRGRIAANAAIVLVFAGLVAGGKIEPWYVTMAAPLLALPHGRGMAAFAGFTAAGIVLLGAQFTGAFPIVAALVAGIATSVAIAIAQRFTTPAQVEA